MPRNLAASTLLTLLASCAGSLAAREGGILVEFCPPSVRECLGDSLEVVFENGASTYEGSIEVGTDIPVDVVVATETPGIQGFSYGVRHDPARLTLRAESVTTASTIIDPGHPRTVVSAPYFDVTRAVPDGFISAVVLSFMDDRSLPVGERLTIARARYTVVSPPGCTLIEFVHNELAVLDSPPVAINVTAAGRSAAPRLVQGVIDAGPCPEHCGDGLDNDGDGLTDCDDAECATRGICPEDCDDGVDDDLDGAIDCRDPDCFLEPPCAEVCDDGVDNNDDGLTDCEDPRCRSGPPCAEECDDGVDNNDDGLIDCEDPRCPFRSPCREVCANGVDDNDNGLVDCDDPQCRVDISCREPEDCNDGIDNDGDRRVDCDDPDCIEVSYCEFVPGADGGILEDRRGDDPDCGEVSLEVVFANDSSTLRTATAPGLEIPVTIVAETRLRGVSGWSYGVRHDPEALDLDPGSVTTSGTVVEPIPDGVAIPPLLDVTRSVPGGFVSAVVLALEAETQLPVKRTRIARAVYVVRSGAQGQLIELVDPEVLESAADVPPGMQFVIGGISRSPCRLRHGRIPILPDPLWENCADGVDNDLDGLVDCADRECAGLLWWCGCHTCALVPVPIVPVPFRRGDADGNGRINVHDAALILLVNLRTRAPPYECNDALDADDDGRATIVDALPILAWVFRRGESLAAPFFACGYDGGFDTDCREASPACR